MSFFLRIQILNFPNENPEEFIYEINLTTCANLSNEWRGVLIYREVWETLPTSSLDY